MSMIGTPVLAEQPTSYLQQLLSNRSTDLQARPPVVAGVTTDVADSEPTASWAGFGTVIPVLAGSPGAGASVLAAVVADAVAAQGLRVLLVDASEPLRSGLLLAAAMDGPTTNGPHPGVRIRHAHRGPIRVARLETVGPSLRCEPMTPPASYWLPPDEDDLGVDVTVVDIGWHAWQGDVPHDGPGTWLRAGPQLPRPILAVRHTVPGARAAEVVLEGLDGRRSSTNLAPVAALVLIGTKKPSAAVVAAAGHHLESLLDRAVCLPTDPGLSERGVTDTETPARLQRSITPLLDTLGVTRSPANAACPPVDALLQPRPSPHHEGALS
jgi:hypothetical protein